MLFLKFGIMVAKQLMFKVEWFVCKMPIGRRTSSRGLTAESRGNKTSVLLNFTSKEMFCVALGSLHQDVPAVSDYIQKQPHPSHRQSR